MNKNLFVIGKGIEMVSDNLAYKIIDFADNAFIDAARCYGSAEKKAVSYYKSLYQQVTLRTYIPILTKDFHSWKNKHIRSSVLSGLFCGDAKPDPRDYRKYIQWLDYTGKLNSYLDRSISYILMRDLGKALYLPEAQAQVKRLAKKLKEYLTQSAAVGREDNDEITSMAWLYRKAQKENIESTIIWLMEKLKTVSSHLPDGMDAEQAERKLIKVIAGVLLHEIDETGNGAMPEERVRRLDAAIHLGYSYGLTYPFIDDLLDANVLLPDEKSRYSDMIRTALVTGTVPELGIWTGKNGELVRYIHSELREAFECIKLHQRPEQLRTFFEQAYVFFHSQEADRRKELTDAAYTNEDLYIPIILKSSSSRLVARSVSGADEDSGFDDRTFYYGIYNQLADDFADMFDDMKEGAVTPYTYYIKHHDRRPDLINPFELYWTVISNLIHNVYHSDAGTCEVILDRAINGLKRYKQRAGEEKFNETMSRFTSGIQGFYKTIQRMVQKADDVDFFDKLLRDRMITSLKNRKAERSAFEDTVKNAREQINTILTISKSVADPLLDQTIVDAANYSLAADGKRVRPLIAWVMGRDIYGLNPDAMHPLLRSLEYMHTASLIFDDLPSQDNADIRRGLPSLHKAYNLATSELAGLFLTQKAVEEQTLLRQFDSETVINIIRYSSGAAQEMCKGQAMDLEVKGKQLTIEQMNTVCFYKTGIAFEACLVMPAILAHAQEAEILVLKKFARYAGIAFQIRDDLLDSEGDPVLLGKATGKDEKNFNSTFVTVLGQDGARKEMWNNYCNAMEALNEVSGNFTFLKQLLNYFVNRDH